MPYWFDYPIRVQPHHTDYSGVVWHGNYIQWMESLRVNCLRQFGVRFEAFVDAGYDLPVVDLQLRYHHPLRLGMAGIVKGHATTQGVRILWTYEIRANDPDDVDQLCVTSQITIVPVEIARRKIARRLPDELQQQLDAISEYFKSP